MKSGKSVSVALRLGVDSGELSYFLDIEIHPDEKLRWLNLDGVFSDNEMSTEEEEMGSSDASSTLGS
jgi:hypothetical protein